MKTHEGHDIVMTTEGAWVADLLVNVEDNSMQEGETHSFETHSYEIVCRTCGYRVFPEELGLGEDWELK